MHYQVVPIGCQRHIAAALKARGIQSEALPFDDILSYPKEVDRLLDLLLKDSSIPHIVSNEFFANLERSTTVRMEHYVPTLRDSTAFTNARTYLTFPYDIDVEEYIRRFHRLREALLDAKRTPLLLIYSDPGGEDAHFSYKGTVMTKYVYEDLQQLSKNLTDRDIDHLLLYCSFQEASKQEGCVKVIHFDPLQNDFSIEKVVRAYDFSVYQVVSPRMDVEKT